MTTLGTKEQSTKRPDRNQPQSVLRTLPNSAPSQNSDNSGVMLVGPNFRVGKKIGCGNFGELRLGKASLFSRWAHVVQFYPKLTIS